MRAAASVVLLLAALSAGAVGVGFLMTRRQGQEQAPAATPSPASGLPAIAVGEPVADQGKVWMGGTPPDIFDETRPLPSGAATSSFVQAGNATAPAVRVDPVLRVASDVMWAGGTPPWLFDETRPWASLL
ncbi:hypothetical protein [Deinococcus sp. YIM 77859]|uniref:hypothetical protein n=1 Tax=Deinococcus sp. YIM 77859 TaxID=1540221 RepID=UPI0005585519|nr:hypothetical protein [Deinococcus sp. YIM 77859]